MRKLVKNIWLFIKLYMFCFYSFMILLVIVVFCIYGFKFKEVLTNSPELQLVIFLIGRYILFISLIISIIFMILPKLLKDNVILDVYIPKGWYVEAIYQLPLGEFKNWSVHLMKKDDSKFSICSKGNSIQSAFNNAVKEVKIYEKEIKKEKK